MNYELSFGHRRPLRTVPLPLVELLEEVLPADDPERWLRLLLVDELAVRSPRLLVVAGVVCVLEVEG